MSRFQRDRGVELAAIAGAGLIALTAPGFGDYPTDAGPALASVAHGNFTGFFSHQPAMGALSLYLRAPFAALAVALHDSAIGVYRWGTLPCLLALAFLAIWLSRVAARRGSGLLARMIIVAVCLLNPLVHDALYWGHPEEILTASLAVGALLAACERRVLLTAVLAGLAIASKQWAVLVLVPVLLIVGRERIRLAVGACAVAAAATLPMLIGNFAALRHSLVFISTPQSVVTQFNWLYPLSPGGTAHASNIFGDSRSFAGHKLYGVEAVLSHPLIVVLGLLIPLLLWWRASGRLSDSSLLTMAAIVFVVRCVLDPSSMPYYHLPLLLSLLAADAVAGRRIPVAGLAGCALSFVVLDRGFSYLAPGVVNLMYVAGSLIGVLLLLLSVRGSDVDNQDRDGQSKKLGDRRLSVLGAGRRAFGFADG